jgi:hypothetical protein
VLQINHSHQIVGLNVQRIQLHPNLHLRQRL